MHIEHRYSEEWTIDKEATCGETGKKSKHCIIDGCTSTIEETIIPVKEHSFGEVEYIWSDDYQILTAKHYCINNEEHYEIESVKTIYEIKKEPTCTNTGIGLYTSIDFNNSIILLSNKSNKIMRLFFYDVPEIPVFD